MANVIAGMTISLEGFVADASTVSIPGRVKRLSDTGWPDASGDIRLTWKPEGEWHRAGAERHRLCPRPAQHRRSGSRLEIDRLARSSLWR